MPPAIMLVQAETDLDERPPFRALGFAHETHSGFLRRAIGFARIALDAGADNVFPNRRPAAIARNHVIKVQIFAIKNIAAILAGIFIALKNVMAREFDFFLRQPVINEQQDDARHADAKGDGVNRFFVRRIFGKVAPFVKIESAERAVVAVDHDLRLALKKQGQRAPGRADIDRLPEPVQNQNVLIEREIHNHAPGKLTKTLAQVNCGDVRVA